MQKITLSVSGMSCQGCADSLSRLFDKEAGISENAVSYDDSAAKLTFDPAKVSENRISEIVTAAGFAVQ